MHIQPTFFIKPGGFKQSDKDSIQSFLTFQKLSPQAIKRAQQKSPLVIGALVSLAEFMRMYHVSRERMNSAVESQQVELVGRSIDPENPVNKKFVSEYNESKTFSQTRLKKRHFAMLLGVDAHTVVWHIKKGHIILNDDGTIDATKPINKDFLENFSKNTRKKLVKYPKDAYDKLQARLGKLPIQYCLDNGLIIADEDGSIDFTAELNKEFLQKVENGEISLKTYFKSEAGFADFLGISISTVGRAVDKGLLIRTPNFGIDINNPINKAYIAQVKEKQAVKDNNPNLLSAEDMQNLLGYESLSELFYQTSLGNLVRNKDGKYNILKEPNKSFIQSLSTGKSHKKRTRVMSEANKQKIRERYIAPGHISQAELAKMLGITQTTLLWHNTKGHLHYVRGKGYDMSDPHNIYFVENYVRWEDYVAPKSNDVQAETIDKKEISLREVDLGSFTTKEFAMMNGLGATTIFYHAENKRVVKNSDNKIDLSNPINAKFYHQNKLRAKEKFETLTLGELVDFANFIKNMFYTRVSKEVFDVGAQLKSLDEASFDNYLQYSFEKIVDVTKLNEDQKDILLSLYKDFVVGRLDSSVSWGFFRTTSKMDFSPFKPILDNLILNKSTKIDGVPFMEYCKTVEKNDEKELVLVEDKVDNDIVETKAFKDFIEIAKKVYAGKIRALKVIEESSISEMVDRYLFSKYIVAVHTGRLLTVTNGINNFRVSEDLNLEKATTIAEKVLTQNLSKNIYKSKDYIEWKNRINPARLTYFIQQVINVYKAHAINTICPDRVFEMLKSDNPSVEISKKEFLEYLMKKFSLS